MYSSTGSGPTGASSTARSRRRNTRLLGRYKQRAVQQLSAMGARRAIRRRQCGRKSRCRTRILRQLDCTPKYFAFAQRLRDFHQYVQLGQHQLRRRLPFPRSPIQGAAQPAYSATSTATDCPTSNNGCQDMPAEHPTSAMAPAGHRSPVRLRRPRISRTIATASMLIDINGDGLDDWLYSDGTNIYAYSTTAPTGKGRPPRSGRSLPRPLFLSPDRYNLLRPRHPLPRYQWRRPTGFRSLLRRTRYYRHQNRTDT